MMTGELVGTLEGAPLTLRASGHAVELSLPIGLATLRGLWRSRALRAVRLGRYGRRLDIDVCVRLGGVPVYRGSLG